MAEIPVVFAHWERFTVWLFERTAGFPKRLRHSLTHRIEARCLDVYEGLATARYSRSPRRALGEVSVALDGLRLLLRLATSLQCWSARQGQHAAEQLDEAGRMVGGWMKVAQ
jgi:hypothetical protein